jgi:phenylacetate-CoA ligase
LLAKFVRDERLTFPEVKGVMLASENVYSWQRTMLKAVFGCRIFSHYGHSEMVLLAMESKTTNDMLVFPEYGYLEVIDEAQKPVTREGGLGELVGTSFHNPVMPFIRYRTQDFGVVGCGPIDGCNYPVLKNIEGRLQEFIVTRDGRLISIATMAAAHFDVFDEVAATQYYQEVPGEIEFRFVPRPGFTARQRRRIEKTIARKIGSAVKVTLREVETIENSPSGKHTMLVQKIPLKELEGSLEHVLRDLPG